MPNAGHTPEARNQLTALAVPPVKEQRAYSNKGSTVTSLTERANAVYEKRMAEALREIGAISGRRLDVFPRIQDLCPEFEIRELIVEGSHLFISKGCHLFCDLGSRNRDEFIIHKFFDEKYSINLLNLVSFYHMTFKSVKYGDIIEIGSDYDVREEFSHVLICFPYFFPDNIVNIESMELNFNLSWIFPIHREEFNFINLNGLESFETAMSNSEYDFFDIRSSMEYLNG